MQLGNRVALDTPVPTNHALHHCWICDRIGTPILSLTANLIIGNQRSFQNSRTSSDLALEVIDTVTQFPIPLHY